MSRARPGFSGSELLRRRPDGSGRGSRCATHLLSWACSGVLRPDVVIHTAYRQDGEGAREIVVDGSENVATAATAVGARLVHISTDVVFDGRKGGPYVEDDPPCPCTEYGRAKADAEARVAAAAPEALHRAHLADPRRPRPRAVQARARGAGPGSDVLLGRIRSPILVATSPRQFSSSPASNSRARSTSRGRTISRGQISQSSSRDGRRGVRPRRRGVRSTVRSTPRAHVGSSARDCGACVRCSHEPARRRDQPLPATACGQPRRLVSVGL